MKKNWELGIAIGALALAACATGPHLSPETAAVSPVGDTCPAGLDGLRTSVADIDGGGSIVFTVAEHDVPLLRERIRRFERQSETRASKPGPDSPWLARSSMRVIDLPRGVQIDARAFDEGRARELRAELHEVAEDVVAGVCPRALRVAALGRRPGNAVEG